MGTVAEAKEGAGRGKGSGMSGWVERVLVWRYGRQAAHRYMHMVKRSRWCSKRLCVTCAVRWATGQMRTARIAEGERFASMRASSSWWPLSDWQVTSLGRRYRTRERPWDYDEYQQWKASR